LQAHWPSSRQIDEDSALEVESTFEQALGLNRARTSGPAPPREQNLNIFTYLTPVTYLLLVMLWSVVAVFYFRRRKRAKIEQDVLLHILLLVLLIDAGRTIFESAFFGAWYSAKLGFLPHWLYDFLVQPQVVFIPKAINMVVVVVVILIILRKWLPQDDLERSTQRARESLLEKTVLDRTESLREANRKLEEDIEKRISAERQLSQANDDLQTARSTFESIFDSIPDALLLVDIERRITAVNGGFTETFGYTAEEVIGLPSSVIYESEAEYERQGRARYNLSAEQRSEPYTVTYRRKDGTLLPGETMGTIVVSPTGDKLGFFGLIHDISERLRQDESIRQTQKLEALGTLSGGIAHDFNNILAAILGFGEIIDEDAEQGSELKGDIQEILQAAQRAKDMVAQILTFSRKGESVREPVQMHLVVGEVMRLLRHTLPTTIEINQHLEAKNDTVLADPTQLHQVCLNLGTNAHHAMRGAAGRLTVTLRMVEIDDARAAELPSLTPGPHVLLTVQDTGIGMDAQTASKVFEPFFTTKPQGEGTGLGMAVVHGIVTSHRGAIVLESRLGEGTRVEVYLPRVAGREDVQEDVESAGQVPLAPSSVRVLIVDDEPALVRVFDRVFRKMGHTTECVTSSVLALERFREAPEAFDLIFTDQTMPEMSGSTLVGELLAIRPDLPIIICTGHSDTLDDARAQQLGARALLAKPISPSELMQAVQDALTAPESPRQPLVEPVRKPDTASPLVETEAAVRSRQGGYTLERRGTMILVRFGVPPKIQEVMRAMEDVAKLGRFERRLWTMEQGIGFSAEDLMTIAEQSRQLFPYPFIVAMVTPDGFSFGLTRLYETNRGEENLAIRSFTREEEALAWLRTADLPQP